MTPPPVKASGAPIAGSVVVTAGGAVVLLGTFLPWLRSGRRWRSSYDLYAVLRRLGELDDGLTRAVFRAWPLVPLLVTISAVVAWVGRFRTAAVVSALTACYVGVAVFVAWRSPLTAGVGLAFSLAGTGAMLLGTAVLVHESRQKSLS